jgi:hypothetical protein
LTIATSNMAVRPVSRSGAIAATTCSNGTSWLACAASTVAFVRRSNCRNVDGRP